MVDSHHGCSVRRAPRLERGGSGSAAPSHGAPGLQGCCTPETWDRHKGEEVKELEQRPINCRKHLLGQVYSLYSIVYSLLYNTYMYMYVDLSTGSTHLMVSRAVHPDPIKTSSSNSCSITPTKTEQRCTHIAQIPEDTLAPQQKC